MISSSTPDQLITNGGLCIHLEHRQHLHRVKTRTRRWELIRLHHPYVGRGWNYNSVLIPNDSVFLPGDGASIGRVANICINLGRDKCVSSHQWILQVDWWVDFVYFTNLLFSMVYLYSDNVIQHSFYVDSNINQVPVFGLWCTHFRESAPLIISILASVVLSGAI